MRCSPIDIACPGCGGKAAFLEPFEFHGRAFDEKSETRPYHRWGGWYVVELFPNRISWKAPTGSCQFLRGGGDDARSGYPLMHYGVVQCDDCHTNRTKVLNWPDDAFWQWEIRGELLWAWDRKQAETIREYIASRHRPGRFNPAVRYVPSHFLSAKNRDAALKAMDATLNRGSRSDDR